MGWVSHLTLRPNPCPAKGWGLLGCVKQGNAFSRQPRVPRQEPERLDRMPGGCDLPLRLATAGSLPRRQLMCFAGKSSLESRGVSRDHSPVLLPGFALSQPDSWS